jgi:PTS system nitrogen regulatory IIA component
MTTAKSMDDLSDLLVPQALQGAIVAPNKKALFQQLAAIAAKLVDKDAKLIVEKLAERERLGSTGFGGGVAIPHGRIEGLDKVIGVFGRLTAPVDFAAIDDLPVDLVFMLLSPIDAGVEHLKALARVSRRMRDKTFVAKLRGAGSNDALYALFASDEARNAA